MPTSSSKRPYHHGNLKQELVTAALEVLSETGVERFSVAQAAKRAGVSSAAPYRHFADREELLAACATVVAEALADTMIEAAEKTDGGPVDRMAATAGAYSRFVIENRVGVDLVYAVGLEKKKYQALHQQSRRLIGMLLDLAVETPASRGYDDVIDLIEAHMAVAHGYAILQLNGGFSRSRLDTDAIAERSTDAARKLLVGQAEARQG